MLTVDKRGPHRWPNDLERLRRCLQHNENDRRRDDGLGHLSESSIHRKVVELPEAPSLTQLRENLAVPLRFNRIERQSVTRRFRVLTNWHGPFAISGSTNCPVAGDECGLNEQPC